MAQKSQQQQLSFNMIQVACYSVEYSSFYCFEVFADTKTILFSLLLSVVGRNQSHVFKTLYSTIIFVEELPNLKCMRLFCSL